MFQSKLRTTKTGTGSFVIGIFWDIYGYGFILLLLVSLISLSVATDGDLYTTPSLANSLVCFVAFFFSHMPQPELLILG